MLVGYYVGAEVARFVAFKSSCVINELFKKGIVNARSIRMQGTDGLWIRRRNLRLKMSPRTRRLPVSRSKFI